MALRNLWKAFKCADRIQWKSFFLPASDAFKSSLTLRFAVLLFVMCYVYDVICSIFKVSFAFVPDALLLLDT